MTEPPPQRYRVVERGRRLEVIDTWNGDRPVSAPLPPMPGRRDTMEPAPSPAAKAPPVHLRLSPAKAQTRQQLNGGRTLRTAAWWDARGPRTLYLSHKGDDALTRAVGYAGALIAILFVVGLFVPPFGFLLIVLAVSKPSRNAVRARITEWLDALDQVDVDSSAP